MRVCRDVTAVLDGPNLASCAGLAPVLQLAERAGLQRLVAGMIAGADSIHDMALLRHGAMKRLFTGVRAPFTLGTFLRAFTFGHVG